MMVSKHESTIATVFIKSVPCIFHFEETGEEGVGTLVKNMNP
jgi:hypothetical protein